MPDSSGGACSILLSHSPKRDIPLSRSTQTIIAHSNQDKVFKFIKLYLINKYCNIDPCFK